MPSTLSVCPVPTIATPPGAISVSGWVECPPAPRDSCSAGDAAGTSTLVECQRNCTSATGSAFTHPRVEVVAPGQTCIACEARKTGDGRARAFAQKGVRSCTNLRSFAMDIESLTLQGEPSVVYLRLNCYKECDGTPVDPELWALGFPGEPPPSGCTCDVSPNTLYGLQISFNPDDPENLDIQRTQSPNVMSVDPLVEKSKFTFSNGRAEFTGRISLIIQPSEALGGNMVIEMLVLEGGADLDSNAPASTSA